MAYANLPADDDVDDAPPVTITRVGGGYSGVRSPKTAPSPAARTPAVDDDDRHRRRGDRRRPSTAATARDRTRDRRAFDPSLTKQLAHKEAALRFELERVRAQNATLVAENDGLRVRLEDARRRFTATEGDFVLQSHELDRARERALGEGARRVAELEDRCDRQRRTLQELAVASEALAKDNVALYLGLAAIAGVIWFQLGYSERNVFHRVALSLWLIGTCQPKPGRVRRPWRPWGCSSSARSRSSGGAHRRNTA
mgnify:CR=1 FL=1